MENMSVVELLQNLIQIKSPYFHEQAVMDFAADWLMAHDVPVMRHRYDAKVVDFQGENLYGFIYGMRTGPHIHLNGHLDTVQQCDGWTRDPFAAEIAGNRIYGLGAVDMKGGVAVMMETLARIAAHRDELCGTVSYSLVSDEEGPYGLGTTFLLADNIIGRPDGVISCEPAGAFSGRSGAAIGLGARGGQHFTIRIYGNAAHAAEPHKGISAISDAANVVLALDTVLYPDDPKLGHGSNCVIKISGGGAACSVADYAEVEVFRHIVRGEDRYSVERETRAVLQKAGLHCRWDLVFREEPAPGFDGGFLPYAVDENGELVKQLKRAVRRVWNVSPAMVYMHSIGDFNLFGGNARIPTILFGPGGGNYHSADEYVLIPNVEKCCDTLTRLFLK